ncbi:CATRA conflict system CASPASE/TPR repeat-associated protein [Nonomuraea wenchangensis]
MTISEQALVIHAYCAVGVSGAAWRAPAERLWAAFAELGEVAELVTGTPAEVPAALAAGEDFTVLATGEIKRPGVYQAVLYREHDVVGLMALLSPVGGRPWTELDEQWPRNATGTLGTVRVYLGVCDRIGAGAARRGFPGEQALWDDPAHPFDDDIAVWELEETPNAGRPSTRRLAVLTRADRERGMYAWLWPVPERLTLRPFARYLLAAAKARHASWVLRGSSWFRRASRTVDGATDHLVRLLDATGRQRVGMAALSEGQTHLALAVNSTAGLVAALRDLRQMRVSVRIAAGQMADALPEGRPLLERDRLLTAVLRQQLEADIGYLRATRDSAADVARSARVVITERLAERARRLTILQTSFLGSLLMALAVVQALEYQVPLPRRLDAPLVAALAALALALPAITERAGELTAPDAFDRISCALFGGALAWLAWSALSLGRGIPPPPPVQTVPAAIAGAVAALLAPHVTVTLLRARDERRRKEGTP